MISKLWKWWWWGGGGKLRRRCCVSSFSNCYFSDKNYQNGVRDTFNFHFLLCFPKNGVKRSKNPSLDDSPVVWVKVQTSLDQMKNWIWLRHLLDFEKCAFRHIYIDQFNKDWTHRRDDDFHALWDSEVRIRDLVGFGTVPRGVGKDHVAQALGNHLKRCWAATNLDNWARTCSK